jgi:hypothetical protein
MLDYQRRVAEFFAKLVSLDDIGKVPESERRELWQEYVTLCGALGSLALEDKAPSPPTKQVKFAALVTHLQRHPPQDPPPKYAKELARVWGRPPRSSKPPSPKERMCCFLSCKTSSHAERSFRFVAAQPA